MTRELPLGTVTFLFSDIEGSTRLLQDLRDRYVGVLDSQQQIIRTAVSQQNGVEIGTEGDSFFCVFRSAPDAVRAAAAAQGALSAHPWPENRTLRVRMGLHTGEAKLGGDDYVGIDVHRAARIASAAHGGQVLLSEATHSLVTQALEGELAFADLGTHRLKDLTSREHLYQLVVRGLQSDFPPPRTLTATAQNLPTTLTSFIGRNRELAAIRELIGDFRLVTLTGPAGVGKTRLAVELGKHLVPAFSDGVTYVSLAGIAAGEAVAPQVARNLSVSEQVDRPAEDTVTDNLRDKTLLLVLDNCEHRRDEVARLTSEWLQAASFLKILATSREPLGVDGERVYRVGPLPLPDTDPPTSDALELEVVQLFSDRARAVDPDFEPSPWIADILAIGRKLDGIPLAIELAAARTNVLTPEQVQVRLDDRFALLKGRGRGALSPHETLEGAIGWSHDTLSDSEAALFRRVAVFKGGFSLEAAEAVCPDEDLPASEILDLLTGLIQKSLVTPVLIAGRARFSVYESIREYAEMRLRESGEWDELVHRHRAWFVDWAEGRASQLRVREQLEALKDLEADHGNLRVVLERSWSRGDADAALALAATLVWFWYLHGHYAEGEHWSDLLLGGERKATSRELVRLMIGSAEFDYRLGHHDRADVRLHAAIEAARALPSRSLEMWAYSHLATNHMLRGSLEAAVEAAAASLAIAEELGDIGAAAYASFLRTGAEAWQAWTAGRLDADLAARLGAGVAPIGYAVRELGDRNMIGHALELTGILSAEAADYETAARDLDDAITAFGELGNAGCAAHCLERIAAVLVGRDPEAAVRLLSAATSLREAVGSNLPDLERAVREVALARCEKALTPSSFEAAWASGKGLTLPEAVALARGSLTVGEIG